MLKRKRAGVVLVVVEVAMVRIWWFEDVMRN